MATEEYHYGRLDDIQKRAYREFFMPWFTSGITADDDERIMEGRWASDITLDDVEAALTAVLLDHPEIVSVRNVRSYEGLAFSIRPSEDGPVMSFHDGIHDVSYAYSAEDKKKIEGRIAEWSAEELEALAGLDDHDKIVMMAKRFSEEFVYLETAKSHGMEGLNTGRMVCEGLAKAFKILCDRLGIWCIIVRGKGRMNDMMVSHVWNIVRLGKEYYHVDPTWAITSSTVRASPILQGKVFSYSYLFTCDDDMSGHHEENGEYPACKDRSLEYYRSRGWTI